MAVAAAVVTVGSCQRTRERRGLDSGRRRRGHNLECGGILFNQSREVCRNLHQASARK